MSIAALDNLVKIRQLAVEPRNEIEIRRLLDMAQTHLADAQQPSVSVEGRYLSAYAAIAMMSQRGEPGRMARSVRRQIAPFDRY